MLAKAANAGLHTPLREFATECYHQKSDDLGGAITVDAHEVMQKYLVQFFKERLEPDKFERYVQELDKRSEARKHAAVINLVALLDKQLLLTAEQREKLSQSLSANYERNWYYYFRQGFGDSRSVPSIRDKSIVALLNDRQKIAWKQIDKQGEGTAWGSLEAQSKREESDEIAHIIWEVKGGK